MILEIVTYDHGEVLQTVDIPGHTFSMAVRELVEISADKWWKLTNLTKDMAVCDGCICTIRRK